jgi:hypothetical protein
MYDFQVEVTTRTGWGAGGRDLNATGCAGGGDPRWENSGFWKSGRPLSRFVHHY